MINSQKIIKEIQNLTETLKKEMEQSEVRSPVEGIYYDDSAMWMGDKDKDKAPFRIQFYNEDKWIVEKRLCDNDYCLRKGEKEIAISSGIFVEGFTKKQAEAIAEALNNLEERL